MTPRKDSLARSLKTDDIPYLPRFFNRAEQKLSTLLNEIENLPSSGETAPSSSVTRRKTEQLLRGYIITDVIGLLLGFVCAWTLAAFTSDLFLDRYIANGPTRDDAMWGLQYFLLGGGIILWFDHTSHYRLRMPFWMEAKKVVETALFVMLIGGFLQFLSKENFSRLWLLSCWLFSAAGIISLRAVWRSVLRKRGAWQIPTLIVGKGLTAQEARLALTMEPSLGYTCVAQVDKLPEIFATASQSWHTLCETHGAEYVVVALDGEDYAKAQPALAQLMRDRIPFSISFPMHNLSVHGMMPQTFLGRDVMLLTRNNTLDHPMARLTKRIFDITIAGTAMVLLSPLFATLAFLIKLDGGPAFYRHNRLGMNGKKFGCLKFRSMVANSDEVLTNHLKTNAVANAEWMRDHKLRKDPRITRVGAFLRRTSIDELPQLINVLRGEMSIVGPRPIIVAETAKYDDDIAFYYSVRPGITGLWQVSGRNNVSYAQRVSMDSWYVRNWSLWHDIAIICKTLPAVLKREGAY